MDGQDQWQLSIESVSGGVDMAFLSVARVREEYRPGVGAHITNAVSGAGDFDARFAVHGALELYGKRSREGRSRGYGEFVIETNGGGHFVGGSSG